MPTPSTRSTRFSPAGSIPKRSLGSFFISDEYGPYVREFTRGGRLVRRISVPVKFALDPVTGVQGGDLDANGDSVELSTNVTGRQANRGMEGLTITPNDRMLVGIRVRGGVFFTGEVTKYEGKIP